MKILLANKYHYFKGGSETYYLLLAQALQQHGHEVIFFSMKDAKNLPCEQEDYFVEHIDYNAPAGFLRKIKDGLKLIYSAEAKRKMEALIKKEQPDIAHFGIVHRQLTLSIVSVLNKHNIPIVFTMHDLICACPNCTMLSHGKICERCLGGRFLHCVRRKCVKDSLLKSILAAAEAYFYKIRKTYNKIDAYLAPSQFYVDKLTQSRFTRSPVLLLRNFLPPDTVFEVAPAPNGPLLYFGRLSPEKGLLTLLDALKTTDMCLVIAGDGPQRQALEQYTMEHGLNGRVNFAGYRTGAELERLLAGCKAVVLPSICYENAPYTVMEAMAKGKPVVASRVGGLPELVEDGGTGYLFQAGDAHSLREQLLRLYALPSEEYAAMCKAAQRIAAAKFRAEAHLDQLIPLYRSLMKQ